jgi:hypothetical protein
MALAAVLTLGACKATGGGYLDVPLEGGPLNMFQGDASFGFNFTCEMSRNNRAVIKGEITYHDSAPSTVEGVGFPEISLHGTVEPIEIFNVSTCQQAASMFEGIPSAQFAGTYRSQDLTLPVYVCVSPTGVMYPGGRFVVNVFDQREPGGSVGGITGDEFSIDLCGGEYPAYTRGGYIEGGNIQVDQ